MRSIDSMRIDRLHIFQRSIMIIILKMKCVHSHSFSVIVFHSSHFPFCDKIEITTNGKKGLQHTQPQQQREKHRDQHENMAKIAFAMFAYKWYASTRGLNQTQ